MDPEVELQKDKGRTRVADHCFKSFEDIRKKYQRKKMSQKKIGTFRCLLLVCLVCFCFRTNSSFPINIYQGPALYQVASLRDPAVTATWSLLSNSEPFSGGNG